MIFTFMMYLETNGEGGGALCVGEGYFNYYICAVRVSDLALLGTERECRYVYGWLVGGCLGNGMMRTVLTL